MSVVMAASAVPFIIAMGVGIDMSRISVARAALQTAVDGAAVAGATAYVSTSSKNNAEDVAKRYFDKLILTENGMQATGTAKGDIAQFSDGVSSFNVTVSATATVASTFRTLANLTPVTISAKAVAGNPVTTMQPVVTLGPVGSTAMDWNSVYMYAVPSGNGGQPNFSAYPNMNQFYEIGSNCNSTNAYFRSNSRCINGFGWTVPTTQTFPTVKSTEALAFMFVNMNNGTVPLSSNGYGPNAYGAQPGDFELMTTADMSLNRPPSYRTDLSTATIKTLTKYEITQGATTYSSLNATATPNCAIQIQVVDPLNLPTSPPYPGRCFSTTDPLSGFQYANMSCAQMAGRTFMYWWNDMGAGVDDYDYRNLYFTVRCVVGSTSPDGGTLATGPGPTSRSVSLIQ